MKYDSDTDEAKRAVDIESVSKSFIEDLSKLSKTEWDMIERSKNEEEHYITYKDWLKENDAQLCFIRVGDWESYLPIPIDWTVDTIKAIIRPNTSMYIGEVSK